MWRTKHVSTNRRQRNREIHLMPSTKKTKTSPVPRMVFVNLADHYGGNVTFAELAGALAGQEQNPAVRAMLQLLRFQLGASRTHEVTDLASAAQRDYGSGAASATEQVIEWAHLLMKRDTERPALAGLRAQYGKPMAESGQA